MVWGVEVQRDLSEIVLEVKPHPLVVLGVESPRVGPTTYHMDDQ